MSFPLSVSPLQGSPPLPLKGARKGASRREFAPFLHPFRGGGVEAKPRRRAGFFDKRLSDVSVLKVSWRPACGLALCDEGVQLRADRRIHEGFVVARKPLFPDAVSPLDRGRAPGFSPGLVVAPIGNDWRIEGILVTRLCV